MIRRTLQVKTPPLPPKKPIQGTSLRKASHRQTQNPALPFLLPFLYHLYCIMLVLYVHMVWDCISYIRKTPHHPLSLPIWEKQSRTPMIPAFCRDHHSALVFSIT